jgi:protein-disulfide isomerase
MLFGKKLNTTAIIFSVLVVILVGAAYFIGNLTAKVQLLEKGTAVAPATTATTANTAQPGQAAPSVSLDTIKALFGKDIIKFGDAKRKVLFVEVADPSCPYCHIAAGVHPEINAASAQFKMVSQGGTYIAPVPEMKKLVDAGKASLAYIYDPGHGNGEMGMKALYCAFEKGKFWEAHDLLMSGKGYEIQNGTDAAGAATTGPVVKNDKTKSQDMANFLAPAVDKSFMKTCLDSGKYDSRLGSDTQLAGSLGVSGTPGFFVNATNFAGAYSFKDMQSAVDAALK